MPSCTSFFSVFLAFEVVCNRDWSAGRLRDSMIAEASGETGFASCVIMLRLSTTLLR